MSLWANFRVIAACVSFALMPAAAIAAEEDDDDPIGTLEVRKEFDGAGPTNLFHLGGTLLGLVDPLEAKVWVIDASNPEAPVRRKIGCTIPDDFRAWRLVRQKEHVTVVSEGELIAGTKVFAIDVPRALDGKSKCTLQARAFDPHKDAFPQFVRTGDKTIEIPAMDGLKKIVVRSERFTLLSVKLLERHQDTRYIFAKALAKDDREAGGRIAVDMYVLRYDADGRLTGSFSLKHDKWKKRAFDYAAVLPDGTVAVVFSEKKKNPDGTPGKRLVEFSTHQFVDISEGAKRRDFARDAGAAPVGGMTAPAGNFSSTDGDDGEEIPVAKLPPASQDIDEHHAWRMTAAGRKYRDLSWNFRIPSPEIEATRKGNRGSESFTIPSQKFSSPWIRPAAHRTLEDGAKMKGMAYSFGGADTIKQFLEKVRERPIGQIGDALATPEPCDDYVYTAGTDCSGFLARMWNIDPGCATDDKRTISTAAITAGHAAVCPNPLATYGRLREGDVIVDGGSHVVLFVETLGVGGVRSPDGASMMIRVLESSSRCSGVCESIYEFDTFHNWSLHRRVNKIGAKGKPELCPGPPPAAKKKIASTGR